MPKETMDPMHEPPLDLAEIAARETFPLYGDNPAYVRLTVAERDALVAALRSTVNAYRSSVIIGGAPDLTFDPWIAIREIHGIVDSGGGDA